MNDDLTNKIIDLEIRLAHQDDLLDALNHIIANQQQQLSQLQTHIQTLYRLHKTQHPEKSYTLQDELPPHY